MKEVSAFYTLCDCLAIECRSITCEDEGEVIESGVKEYYSEVPMVDNSFGFHSFKYLGSPDYSMPFRYLAFPHGVGGGQTKEEPGFMFINGKLIYKNIADYFSDMKVVTIAALTKFGSCDGTECDLDKPYNIPGHLIAELEGLVLKRLGMYANKKKDEINDTNKS